MSDKYIARLARVVPPRTGNVRAITNVSNATASVELDNDIFQVAPTGDANPLGAANTPGRPGNYGKALMRVQAESNDVWVLFGKTSGVFANSAANTGANVCSHIPVNQDRDFEIDPQQDLFMSVTTQNGTTNTATARYWIVSFPDEYR